MCSGTRRAPGDPLGGRRTRQRGRIAGSGWHEIRRDVTREKEGTLEIGTITCSCTSSSQTTWTRNARPQSLDRKISRDDWHNRYKILYYTLYSDTNSTELGGDTKFFRNIQFCLLFRSLSSFCKLGTHSTLTNISHTFIHIFTIHISTIHIHISTSSSPTIQSETATLPLVISRQSPVASRSKVRAAATNANTYSCTFVVCSGALSR